MALSPLAGILTRTCAGVVSFTVSATFSADNMADNMPEVCVRQGKLRGVMVDNMTGGQYYAFRGIPYATPPVGELRFKDPLPPKPWSGVRDASKFGNSCIQMNLITWKLVGDEDCLYLNVYVNSWQPQEKKPVMVYIYGGGYSYGSGDDNMYSPDYLIKKDIVLVTFNYRVNVFGFLNLEDEVAPGNQGLKDQVMALRWVQQNIAAFGGDENNVTIFGQSAGASSVHYLCISPMAQGLFRRAIAQSGVATNPWASVREPRKVALRLASLLGEKSTDPKTVVEFLRKVDAKTLVQMAMRAMTTDDKLQVLTIFAPGSDPASTNPFFPKPHTEIINCEVKVPLLIGYNCCEGTMGFYYIRNILGKEGKPENMLDLLNKDFKRAIPAVTMDKLKESNISLQEFKRWYFGDELITEAHIANYVNMISDVTIAHDVNELANTLASRQTAPVYMYQFTYDSDQSFSKIFFQNHQTGAGHCDELPYIFFPKLAKLIDWKPHSPGSPEHKVMTNFVQMWTDFAKTGNPTPAKTDTIPVIWEPLKSGDTQNILFIADELRMVTVPKYEIRSDWRNIKHKL